LEALGMPDELYDFMNCCLKLNPEDRFAADKLLTHAYFGENYAEEFE
jgi:hypothetical protein